MGTCYCLYNYTKQEVVFIDGVGQKYFELMSLKYSNFVVWLMLNNWEGNYVVLCNEQDSSEYPSFIYSASNKSIDYWKQFNEFMTDNKWYFNEEEGR